MDIDFFLEYCFLVAMFLILIPDARFQLLIGLSVRTILQCLRLFVRQQLLVEGKMGLSWKFVLFRKKPALFVAIG